MTPEELRQRLLVMGVACSVRRAEVVVETCRFCGNPKHNLELNPERGLFHCWACNAGGRLDALLTEWLGEAIQLPVRTGGGARGRALAVLPPGEFAAVPAYSLISAAHYLERRGVGKMVAEQYGMVVCMEEKHQLHGRLVLPVLDFWTEVVIGYIGRTITNARPKYLSTLRVRVVVGYRVRSLSAPCVVVEGVFDGIMVHRAGYHAALLLGTSAPRVEEFAARLPPSMPLVVMLDGEAAAEADRLRWALQAVRGCEVAVVNLAVGIDPAQLLPSVLKLLVERVVV